MKDKMRKRYQNKLNKLIKKANCSLEEDELFLGRFVARQTDACWDKFQDNSGGILSVNIRVIDKKNGYYKDYILEYAPFFETIHWNINMNILNDFIVNYSNFWLENTKYIDYRKTEINNDKWNINKFPYNYYLDYKNFDKEKS